LSDLRILETVIAGLLAIYIVRPFVRKFRDVDGLFAMPAISFLLAVAAVPAFGFRPELLPLSLFAFFAFLSSLPRLADVARRLRTDDYGESSPAAATALLLTLCVFFAFAFVFTPREGRETRPDAEGASFAVVDEGRGVRLVLTVEGVRSGAFPEPGPAVVFSPPVLGSAGIFGGFREALVSRGFTVVTCVRPGLDAPALDEEGRLRLPTRAFLFDALAALAFGDELAFAAEAGSRLEQERLEDLRFAVAYVRSRALDGDARFGAVDAARLSVAGYGAGGAAAALFAAEADPAEVRSVAAMEAPIHSYFTFGTAEDEIPRTGLARYFRGVERAFRIRTAQGSVRGERPAAAPRVPVLVLAADWIGDARLRERRYGTLIGLFGSSPGPSAIASAAGAGPLDYSDIPLDYPVYAFFARGADRFIPFGTSFSSQAADLVAGFAESFSDGLKPAPGVRIEKK
jgi:hypothetical protein